LRRGLPRTGGKWFNSTQGQEQSSFAASGQDQLATRWSPHARKGSKCFGLPIHRFQLGSSQARAPIQFLDAAAICRCFRGMTVCGLELVRVAAPGTTIGKCAGVPTASVACLAFSLRRTHGRLAIPCFRRKGHVLIQQYMDAKPVFRLALAAMDKQAQQEKTA